LAEAVVALRGRALKHIHSALPPASRVVDQFNYQFVPETTAIRAGETVTFTNSDATTHNVRSAASIAMFNITMEADDEFTYRFDRAGGLTSPVLLDCVYHGGMRGWIYVFDHPYFAVTGPDGRFRFEEVPPGRYTLEMVHPAGGLRWKQAIEVVLNENEDLTVDIRLSPDHKRLR
jgi:plastocyanin